MELILNECSFHSVLWVLKTSSQFTTRFHCILCYTSTWGYYPPLPGSKLNLNPVQLRTFNCFRCESACQFMRAAFRSCCQSKGTSHTRSICKAAVNVRALVFIALVLTSFCWGSPLASWMRTTLWWIWYKELTTKLASTNYRIIQILALYHLSDFET